MARAQLVKGKDDLRQDAVMEQVFGLLNQLLSQNPQTVKRKLTVKTYKVVPLSQRSGVLGKCSDLNINVDIQFVVCRVVSEHPAHGRVPHRAGHEVWSPQEVQPQGVGLSDLQEGDAEGGQTSSE